MQYRSYNNDKQSPSARRQEQVRHLLRSVGVELDGGARVPYFVENAPGRFRRNPVLKTVEVRDEQLRTLNVPAEVPAKIPADGLPVAVLKHLVEMGVAGTDDL
jgi:hypothetical protein